MSMTEIVAKLYDDGRTKQSFKDSTDINKILKKAQISGGLAHALKYDERVYGEFTGVDLLGAFEQCNRAQAIFDDLPAEVRKEFDQDAFKFAGYASDPVNVFRLKELIPSIAEPDSFFERPLKVAGAPVALDVAGVEPAVDPVVADPVVPRVAPDSSSGT